MNCAFQINVRAKFMIYVCLCPCQMVGPRNSFRCTLDSEGAIHIASLDSRLLVLTNTQRSPTIGPRQIYRAPQSPVDVTDSLTVHITVHDTVHVTVHLRICVTAQFIMVQSEMNRSREVIVLQFKYRSTQITVRTEIGGAHTNNGPHRN